MFKHLLSAVLLSSFSVAVYAQCTPNPAYADSSFGVWPDTTTNLPFACPNVSSGYNAVIDIKTLTDTAVAISLAGQNLNVNAYIQSFRINEVQGLPQGFSYIPNQAIWTNGGASPNFTPVQGCVSILANQASIQALADANPAGIDIPLTVIVDAKIANTDNVLANTIVNNVWLSELTALPGITAIPVSGYKIRVRPATDTECAAASVAELIAPMSIKGNVPNPFSKNTTIRFTSDASKKVTLKVINMVGKVVHTQNIQATKGENTVNFNGENLSAGVYFYTLTDGKSEVARRMVISER
jgi:hypothetical protein